MHGERVPSTKSLSLVTTLSLIKGSILQILHMIQFFKKYLEDKVK